MVQITTFNKKTEPFKKLWRKTRRGIATVIRLFGVLFELLRRGIERLSDLVDGGP